VSPVARTGRQGFISGQGRKVRCCIEVAVALFGCVVALGCLSVAVAADERAIDGGGAFTIFDVQALFGEL
jgi:hypothetical protein